MSDELCKGCPVPEYCYDFGCLKDEEMTNRCGDCNTPDTCNRGGCVNDTVCCGDPSDCSEDCYMNNADPSVGSGSNEATNLDGRNEGEKNSFGCSYVDCDCTEPCYDKASKNVYITINGDLNGDIKL